MGETLLDAGRLQEAAACYDEALRLGEEAEDPLLIAKARAGFGAKNATEVVAKAKEMKIV